MSIIDRKYILKRLSKIIVYRINESIKIRDINAIWHDTFEYVFFDFYIFEKTNVDISIKAHFCREIHLMNDLSIKIFIDINVIVSKKIIIDEKKQFFIIENCDITIKLKIASREFKIERVIKLLQQLIISSYTYIIVSIKIRKQTFFINRDFFFNSRKNSRFETKKNFFAYIIDVNITTIQIRNVINTLIMISRNFKLNKLQKHDEKNCFLATSKNRHLIVKFFE